MSYAELVADARARLVTSGSCRSCGASVVWLSTPRGRVPVQSSEPVRGSAASVRGAQSAVLVCRNGWTPRVSLAPFGDVVGWILHRCS
jgi:hypothetical protein